MNAPNPIQQVVDHLCLSVSGKISPGQFRAFLIGGVLGNVIGHLSDDYWREFTKIEICGEPGCNCHELHEKLMPILDQLRDEMRKHLKTQRQN